MSRLTKLVYRVHFEDHGGKEFERLVFAYHLRMEKWRSLEWYGQSGGDLGRDIWGIREDGSTVCIQCANRRRIGHQKAIQAIDDILQGPGGIPNVFRFVCACNVSATARDKIKTYAKTKGIKDCDIWSGVEFEENLRSRTESLLKRFVEGVEFPDSPEELSKFIAAPTGQSTVEKQFDAHQQFHTLWRSFKNGLWHDDLRNKAEADLRRWLDQNGLLLDRELREKVRLCLCEVARFPGWRDRNEHEAAEFQEKVIQISKDIEEASDVLAARPLEPIGPRFTGRAYVRSADPRTALSFVVTVELSNDGDRTARGVRVTVKHGDTNCVAASHDENVWDEVSTGMLRPLNPRHLRARHNINPKEKVPILPIPLCERTIFPFHITVRISAEDMEPSSISGIIPIPEANQIITLAAA
jgi:hypothetical protein